MGRPARPELHEALLDAARIEFSAHGLERARVEDVARRAGVSKGAFYLHFETKEDAFEELLQRFLGAMNDQVRRREEAEACFLHEHAGLSEAALRERQVDFDCKVDLALLETFWRNRQFLAVIENSGVSRYRRIVNEFRHRTHAFVTGRLTEKRALGLIRRDADPAVMADILIGSYEGFMRRIAGATERPDLEGWLQTFTQVLYEGMLERPTADVGPAARPSPAPPARRAERASSPRRRRSGNG